MPLVKLGTRLLVLQAEAEPRKLARHRPRHRAILPSRERQACHLWTLNDEIKDKQSASLVVLKNNLLPGIELTCTELLRVIQVTLLRRIVLYISAQ